MMIYIANVKDDVQLDGRLILKWIFKLRIHIGLICLKISASSVLVFNV